MIHLNEDKERTYKVIRHTGKELITGLDADLSDFWSWGYSDLLCNTTRSVFAEYIIGKALGLTEYGRKDWVGYDLLYEGKKIEVKASSSSQSWSQKGKPYPPSFEIKIRKKSWDPSKGEDVYIRGRQANCYVFCIFAYGLESLDDKDKFEVPRLSDWRFYVLSTKKLEEEIGKRGIKKRISANTLKGICGEPIGHEQLKKAIDDALGLKE